MASLYVHIPFCKQKCLYCDFCSVAGTDAIEQFLTALIREISLQGERRGAAVYDTVFFGGGTPSLLTPRQLEGVLRHLHRTVRISPEAEITLETNPGTATRERLAAFRTLGVNRLSVGVQSFHDHELVSLGRMHDSAAAARCITDAREAGFLNVGVDLIYSIPGQTLADWEASLAMAIGLHPEHMAAYALSIEEDTPLARSVRAGAVRPNPPELEATMYERAMAMLAAHGYEHYEVSNYARPGYRCRHNGAYWRHADYLGLGPSAHSFWKSADGRAGTRWWNTPDLPTYIARLQEGLLPVAGDERIGADEMLEERILLGLRSGGVDLARLQPDVVDGLDIARRPAVRWMIDDGLAVHDAGVLRLTPRGLVVCDEVCARLVRELVESPALAASRSASTG